MVRIGTRNDGGLPISPIRVDGTGISVSSFSESILITFVMFSSISVYKCPVYTRVYRHFLCGVGEWFISFLPKYPTLRTYVFHVHFGHALIVVCSL